MTSAITAYSTADYSKLVTPRASHISAASRS